MPEYKTSLEQRMKYRQYKQLNKNNPNVKSFTKEYINEYYKNNTNKWLKKTECKICNCMVSKAGFKRHLKTKKHQFLCKKASNIDETNTKIELLKQVELLKTQVLELSKQIKILN